MPEPGDEFEFLTYGSVEGDFSVITGLQITETRCFVPTRTEDGYTLTVVDVVSLYGFRAPDVADLFYLSPWEIVQ